MDVSEGGWYFFRIFFLLSLPQTMGIAAIQSPLYGFFYKYQYKTRTINSKLDMFLNGTLTVPEVPDFGKGLKDLLKALKEVKQTWRLIWDGKVDYVTFLTVRWVLFVVMLKTKLELSMIFL